MEDGNKKVKAGYGGVTLENVQVQMYVENISFRRAIEILILCAGTWGTVFSFLSGFKFNVNMTVYTWMILAMCVIWYVVFQLKSRQRIIIVAVFLLGLLTTAILFNHLFLESVESMIYAISGKTGQVTDEPARAGYDMVIIMLIGVLGMAEGYVAARKPNMPAAIAMTVPICMLPIGWDHMPGTIPLIMAGTYLASMAAVTGCSDKNKSRSNVMAGITGALVLIICIVLLTFVPEQKYLKKGMFDGVRVWIQNSFLGQALDSAINLEVNGFTSGGLNGGELGKNGKIFYSGEEMLRVTSGSISNTLYLRGYIGASYGENSWTDLTQEEENQYRDVFSMAQSARVNIYNQTSEFMNLLDNDEALINSVSQSKENYLNSVFKRNYKVEYMGAPWTYYYQPYGSLATAKEKSAADGYPLNLDQNYLDSIAYENEHADYGAYKKLVDTYLGDNPQMLDYRRWEAAYRKLVYNLYTQVPDLYLPEIKTLLPADSIKTQAQQQAFIKVVQKYFSDNFTYTIEPGATPEGKDFIEYFLNESKMGYCTHFASAAVMIFREAGIPARYVEGYAVKAKNPVNAGQEIIKQHRGIIGSDVIDTYTQYTVPVRDYDAHAWVELYEDGYGWVPVEITPGREGISYVNDDSANTVLDYSEIYGHPYGINETSLGSADNQDSGTEDETTIRTEIEKVILFLLIVLKVVIVMFVILAVVFLIHVVIRKKRKKIFDRSREDLQIQIMELYGYLELICAFLKLKKSDAMSYKDYAEYLKQRNDGFFACKIDTVIDLVLKASFASEEQKNLITREEVSVAIDSIEILRKNIYSRSGKMKKCLFRFVYNLYE